MIIKRHKITSSLLAVLMLLSSVSCSSPTDTAGNDTKAPEANITSADTKSPEETKTVYSADIPEGTDMDGYEFRIMVNDESHYWVDINNDGAYTMGEDMMVTGYAADQLPILLISGGNFITTKDDEDIPQLTFYNERMVSAYEALASWLFNDELAQLSGGSIDAFGVGKLLMVLCEMHCIPHLRNMEEDFGILPFPKYEAEQDRYYHVINPNVACAMMIPITVADPGQVGLIAEVLAAEGKNYITPAYYDYNLTSRDTRDEESVGMLDIIFATTTYDAAHIYDLGGVGTMLRGLASTKNENVTSAFEKISKSVQKYIDRSVEKYQEIEGTN